MDDRIKQAEANGDVVVSRWKLLPERVGCPSGRNGTYSISDCACNVCGKPATYGDRWGAACDQHSPSRR